MSQSLTIYGLLVLAIVSEETGSKFLAKSEGFTKPLPTAITVVCLFLSSIYFSKL